MAETSSPTRENTSESLEAWYGDVDAVPDLLLRSYRAVMAAGGAMYGTDMAEALGVRAQQLGKELTRILRDVGITRPRNGTVSPVLGEPYRNGYLAETLAAAIAAYRCRAQLAPAA